MVDGPPNRSVEERWGMQLLVEAAEGKRVDPGSGLLYPQFSPRPEARLPLLRDEQWERPLLLLRQPK